MRSFDALAQRGASRCSPALPPALPPTKWRRRLISVRPPTFTPWEQNTCGRARRADTFSARRAALSPCPGLPHIPSACEGMRKFVRPRPGSPLLVRHARPNARVLCACEHPRPHLPVPTCSATLANNAFPVWPHSAGCLTLCCGAAARSPAVRDRAQLLHIVCGPTLVELPQRLLTEEISQAKSRLPRHDLGSAARPLVPRAQRWQEALERECTGCGVVYTEKISQVR